MNKFKKLFRNRVDMADYMVLTGIFLGALYWALESLLNVFSPAEISFYQEIFGPNISEVWPRLIVFCLFLMFGSHVQFTINERKKAEEALKASEEKYRTILESIEEGYYEVDIEGYFVFGNDALTRILGVSKVDLRFMNFWDFMDEENAGRVYETFSECRRTGRPVKAFDCEFKVSGAILYIEASVALLQDSIGRPIGYRGVLRDRTEKKKMEMDLLESYRKVHEARAATILGDARVSVLCLSDPLADLAVLGTGPSIEVKLPPGTQTVEVEIMDPGGEKAEDVFTIKGRGTVVTGRVERGLVNVNEEIEIVGLKETRKTVVTGVEMFRKLLDQGQAGDNIGVLLRGVKRDEIERGQVLAKPGSITPHTKFKGEIYVLSKEEGGRHTPFFNGYRPQFYFRTTDVTGTVTLPAGVEMVMPGDNVSITGELITPIAMEQELRFAVREGGRTVGAGVVAEIIE